MSTPPPALPPGKSQVQLPNPLRQGVLVWLATGAWVGLMPVASGTWGALWGLPLAWGIEQLGDGWLQAAVIACLCGAGIPLCTVAARKLGGIKDPGAIVFDEIVSLPITFFLVPMHSAEVVVAGFLLNRFFDITKPPPARALEHLPDGLGVMADDWIAGVYSNAALHLLVWLSPLGRLSG